MYMQQVTEYDVTNISGTQPQKNMITMGKWFDDDNKISYGYILSITQTEMGQLNIYNHGICYIDLDKTSNI